MDAKNLSIATLTITAVVLVAALAMLGSAGSNDAYARGMNDRGGNYIMATQAILPNSEVLLVINAAKQQLNLYTLNSTTRALELKDSIRLDQRVFGGGDARGRRGKARGGRNR